MEQKVKSYSLSALPEIGAELEGGKVAGVSIEDNKPVLLVLLPASTEATFKKAGEWAKKQGGTLPSRIDSLVLFKNLKADFPDGGWHWTDEKVQGDESSAWSQNFYFGYQYDTHIDTKLRARAVRRLVIE